MISTTYVEELSDEEITLVPIMILTIIINYEKAGGFEIHESCTNIIQCKPLNVISLEGQKVPNTIITNSF
jgi:hypothetical protein